MSEQQSEHTNDAEAAAGPVDENDGALVETSEYGDDAQLADPDRDEQQAPAEAPVPHQEQPDGTVDAEPTVEDPESAPPISYEDKSLEEGEPQPFEEDEGAGDPQSTDEGHLLADRAPADADVDGQDGDGDEA